MFHVGSKIKFFDFSGEVVGYTNEGKIAIVLYIGKQLEVDFDEIQFDFGQKFNLDFSK